MDTKKLRQKILDLAIHGKLVPQDPNDEPASVLLERIRAEKEQLIKEGKIKAPKKSKSAGDRSHYPKDGPWELPEGWEWTTLDTIARFSGGKTPSMDDRSNWENGKHLWITSKDMKLEAICDSLIKLSDTGLQGMTIHHPGTILMVNRSGILRRTLPLGILQKEATINQDLKAITPFLFELTPFLFFCLKAFEPIILQNYKKAGTTVDNINFDHFVTIPIPLPPVQEQGRIVQSIKNWKNRIEDIEESGIQIQKTIDATKSIILELAIHGKLVAQDPSDEPAIELLRRINPAFQPSHNLHYLDCPSGWAVTQMKSIIELLSGRDLDNSRCNSEGYGVPYLVGASCIDKGRINTYRWTETPEVISKEGDVLLSCKGTVGEVVLNTMGNLHIARQFMAIRSKAPQYILPDYLGIIIKASIETLKKAARGIIPGISREDILGLTVMIPPSEEQQRILSRIAEFNQSVSLIVANTCN